MNAQGYRARHYAAIGLTSLLLSACVSRPVDDTSIGARVGYQEKPLADDSYRLSYTDRAGTTGQPGDWKRMEDLWHQRARELCGHDRYRSSAMQRGEPCRSHYLVYGQYLRREKQCLLELSGRIDCR